MKYWVRSPGWSSKISIVKVKVVKIGVIMLLCEIKNWGLKTTNANDYTNFNPTETNHETERWIWTSEIFPTLKKAKEEAKELKKANDACLGTYDMWPCGR